MFELNGKMYVSERGARISEGYLAAAEAGLGEGYWKELYGSLHRATDLTGLEGASTYIAGLALDLTHDPEIIRKLGVLREFYQNRKDQLTTSELCDRDQTDNNKEN